MESSRKVLDRKKEERAQPKSMEFKDMPEHIQKIFDERKNQLMFGTPDAPLGYDAGEYIDYGDGVQGYGVVLTLPRTLAYPEIRYILVTDEENGTYVGRGSVRYDAGSSSEEPFVGYPYIQYVDTGKSPQASSAEDIVLQKRGLGRRRYRFMNALCIKHFHQPLYSGVTNEQSQAVWESLTKTGIAEQLPNAGDAPNYRFKL